MIMMRRRAAIGHRYEKALAVYPNALRATLGLIYVLMAMQTPEYISFTFSAPHLPRRPPPWYQSRQRRRSKANYMLIHSIEAAA